MVLYRKYRPQILGDVLGQEHVRDPLLACLKAGKLSHAYLFTGPRGTGKTSVARILAKAINCQKTVSDEQKVRKFGEPCNDCDTCEAITRGSHLDIMEIDAASNRGIDEIRDLREKIKLSPSSGRFKVYIIDEAHMLTQEAFNALLKTLEEPPEHVIFVLATTEPQKIPATIASRTTKFDFKVPTVEQIRKKLGFIAKQERWSIPEQSLEEIARMAGGAFRDAEVLLEKVASFDSKADLAKTREILGKKETQATVALLTLVQEGATRQALIWLDTYVREGGSIRVLVESILDTLRKTLLILAGAGAVIGVVTEEEAEQLRRFAKTTTRKRTLELVDLFNKSVEELRNATIPQLPLEIAIVEATIDSDSTSNEKVEVGSNKDTHIEDKDTVKEEKTVQETKKSNVKSEPDKKEQGKIKKVVASSKNKDKTLKKLQEGWSRFLKELKQKNSSLELFFRKAKPIEIDEDLLTIEFAFRFHKQKVEEKKYRSAVEEVLEKFTGVPLRIKAVAAQKAPEPEESKDLGLLKKKEDADPVSVFGNLD